MLRGCAAIHCLRQHNIIFHFASITSDEEIGFIVWQIKHEKLEFLIKNVWWVGFPCYDICKHVVISTWCFLVIKLFAVNFIPTSQSAFMYCWCYLHFVNIPQKRSIRASTTWKKFHCCDSKLRSLIYIHSKNTIRFYLLLFFFLQLENSQKYQFPKTIGNEVHSGHFLCLP